MLNSRLVRLGAVAALAAAASFGTHGGVSSAEETCADCRLRRQVRRRSLVRRQHGSGAERRDRSRERGGRRQAGRWLYGDDGAFVLRRSLQCGGGHFRAAPHRRQRCGRRHRSDLLERRRAALRHPAEDGRRRGRFGASNSGLHRYRHQGRVGEDLPVGVSATFPTKARCTGRCSSGSVRSIRTSRPSMAVSRRISPIPASPGTR